MSCEEAGGGRLLAYNFYDIVTIPITGLTQESFFPDYRDLRGRIGTPKGYDRGGTEDRVERYSNP
jgi:hypothetical protein